MALPAAIEYSSQPIREAFAGLAYDRDLAARHEQRHAGQLRQKRDALRFAESRLRDATAERDRLKRGLTAAAGTEAEATMAARLRRAEEAIEYYTEKAQRARDAVAEAEAPHKEAAARREALEGRMRAISEAVAA